MGDRVGIRGEVGQGELILPSPGQTDKQLSVPSRGLTVCLHFCAGWKGVPSYRLLLSLVKYLVLETQSAEPPPSKPPRI